MLANPVVDARSSGRRSSHHLDDAVAAVELELDERELAELSETYAPRGIAGHQ